MRAETEGAPLGNRGHLCRYGGGISVRWTAREWAKIREIKARQGRSRQWHRTPYDRNLEDLWRYWEYFFHPEVDVNRKMQWEPQA